MHALHLLTLAALTAAAPLPQFDAHGYKPYQESFFGASPINRQALRNPLTNPYTNPYGLPPPGLVPPYGAPAPPYQHQLVPGPCPPYDHGFTAPGEPLPPIAHEPVLEPIDLMSAPKSALPKPPSADDEPTPESGDTFLAPSPPAEGVKSIKPLVPSDEPQGVAGTGWYLDSARKDHKVSPATTDMRKCGDWAEARERKNRFNPHRGGFRQAMGLEPEHDEASDKSGDGDDGDGAQANTQDDEEEQKPEPLPPVEVKPAQDGRLKYEVNIGGVGSNMRADGEDGEAPEGPSNFHTWTQEGTKKLTGDSMDPECQKYIQEKMLPKLGGKRRKGAERGRGGCVFSVFGDD